MIAMIWFLTILLAASQGEPLPVASVLTSYWLLLSCKPDLHLKAMSQIKAKAFYSDWSESPVKSYVRFVHGLIKLHYYYSNQWVFMLTYKGR